MGLKFGGMVSLLTTIFVGPRTEAWTENDCSSSSKSNDLKTSALLYAHRCYLKDIPIAIPAPINTIPDQILPSHIVVPRCSGLCLDSLGSSCVPKKTKVEVYPVTVYVNGTPYCTSIELEHHRGPCRCDCGHAPQHCSPRQHWLPQACQCQCRPSLTQEKLSCTNSSRHVWDNDDCQCTCRHVATCGSGQVFNTDTCQCEEMFRDTCDQLSSASLTTYKVYMMNIILMGVLVVIVVVSIYWLACRSNKTRYQLRYSNNMYHQAADGEENIMIEPRRYSMSVSGDKVVNVRLSSSNVTGEDQIG